MLLATTANKERRSAARSGGKNARGSGTMSALPVLEARGDGFVEVALSRVLRREHRDGCGGLCTGAGELLGDAGKLELADRDER
jgi:hypothetical protein